MTASTPTAPHATDVRVFVYGKPSPELTEALNDAQATTVDDPVQAIYLVWNSFKNHALRDVLHPGIRWVQLPSAGINHWRDVGVLDGDRTWLSAAGAYSGPVAAHAVASYLAAIHRIPEFATATTWERLEFRPLHLRRVAILGLGGIGTEIARQLQALGVREVRGVVRNQRHDPHADSVTTLDDPQWRTGIDDIINVLPATSATRHVIDAEVLAALPAYGSVVNAL